MNRREFAYVSAFAGALATPALGGRAGQPERIPEGAGLITELVFIDDCVRVAMYDPALSGAAKTALTSHGDFVRNGVFFPGGSDAKTAEVYALAAGKVFSAALARRRNPSTAEARLYQDIAVMRDLAVKDGCDPSKPAPVADLFDLIHVRRRLGLHTLNPDNDIHKWLEGVVTWWHDEHDLRAALAAIYTAPDSAKTREFVSDFYNPADPLIRLARGFQFAEGPPADALHPALNQASSGSRYAHALAEAIEGIRSLPQPIPASEKQK
jgi:hypothetical protein